MLELLEGTSTSREKRIAVVGLAFRPGTDDIRGSRADQLASELTTTVRHVVDATGCDWPLRRRVAGRPPRFTPALKGGILSPELDSAVVVTTTT